MMIIDILTDSIRYSISKLRYVLILGFLNCLELFFPTIFLSGYLYRITKESTMGMIGADEQLPEFNNFKVMFVDGIKYVVVFWVYILTPFALIVLSSLFIDYHNHIIYLIAAIIMFFFTIFAYVAIANMAYHDSFKKAFAFGEMYNIVKNKIGIVPVILLALILKFIDIVFENINNKVFNFAGSIFNLNKFTFFSFDTYSFESLPIIIAQFVFIFFIDVFMMLMISRATGLLYLADDD